MQRFLGFGFFLGVLAFSAASGAAAGAPPPEDAAAASGLGAEHAALAEQTGEFELTVRYWAEPNAEPEVSQLRARRQMILGGRVMRLDVDRSSEGFEGTGLFGFDRAKGKFWYVWTDNTDTGYSLLEGELDANLSGALRGKMSSPSGDVPLTIRRQDEGDTQLHEYWIEGPDGAPWRMLELRYRRSTSN